MDNAVALVQAYLYANGYFTATEYPVVEVARAGGSIRTATDIDILAVRFPHAGRLVPHRGRGRAGDVVVSETDSALEPSTDRIDLIVGEVKEGRAELNHGARDPAVLRAVLTRFGAFDDAESESVVRQLLETGSATTPTGPRIRLMAFGSYVDEATTGRYSVITLGHIVRFLREMVEEYWPVMRRAQLKDPALGFMMLLEKATRFDGAGDDPLVES